MNSICKKVSFALTACACAVLAGCGATTGGGVKTQDTAAAAPATTNTTVRADGYHSDWSVAHNVLAAGDIQMDVQDALVDDKGNIVKPLQGNLLRQPTGVIWLPTSQIKSYEEGAAWLEQHLANAMADGLAAQKFKTAYGLGVKSPEPNRPWVRGAAIVFSNPALGCPQPPKSAIGKAPAEGFCDMMMNTADLAQPELAAPAPAWMDKSAPAAWRYTKIGVGLRVPEKVKINVQDLMHVISEKLPGGAFLYVPPVQTAEGVAMPFVLNQGKVLPFALPQTPTAAK